MHIDLVLTALYYCWRGGGGGGAMDLTNRQDASQCRANSTSVTSVLSKARDHGAGHQNCAQKAGMCGAYGRGFTSRHALPYSGSSSHPPPARTPISVFESCQLCNMERINSAGLTGL